MEFSDEYQSLVGSYLTRDESPAVEIAAAKAIEQAFRHLLETRYFYQKVAVDYAGIDLAVKEAVREAELRAAEPQLGGRPGRSQPIAATQQRLNEFHTEIEKRPWRLVTRHAGDDETSARIHRVASAGTQPLGTPIERWNLGFFLPALQLHCSGPCKRASTFIALVSSGGFASAFSSPYPRDTARGVEQMFTPIYRCEFCREAIYTMLVRRVAGRLHLCGFAPRREAPQTQSGLPSPLAAILSDADQAAEQADTFAAFYHLRTLVEHYLKQRLAIPIADQMRGDQLVERHHKVLGPQLSAMLPSLSTAWANLSEWLHTRTGKPEDYQRERARVLKHVAALEALGS